MQIRNKCHFRTMQRRNERSTEENIRKGIEGISKLVGASTLSDLKLVYAFTLFFRITYGVFNRVSTKNFQRRKHQNWQI